MVAECHVDGVEGSTTRLDAVDASISEMVAYARAKGIGLLAYVYPCLKFEQHAEAYANLGVLELRKGNIDAARSNFSTAQELAPHMFEPFFNGALLAFKLGDFQEAYTLANKALEAFPDHHDSQELLKLLKQHFTML